MEARHLLKQLKDDDWYLGDTEGSCRQYIHGDRAGFITVCVRYNDELGPQTEAAAFQPAEADAADPSVVVEQTSTGVSAYLEGLPGCVATGRDEAEARDRLARALALHRQSLEEETGA
jgi:predicted RNA binding protein YcfA (HicA-like mRNA interferase family)